RNTYLDAPRLLDRFSRSRIQPHLFFAGQITGVEGYIESTASGLVVGIMAGLLAAGMTPEPPPAITAVGGLMRHTRGTGALKYEPMNVNFGLMDPPPPGTKKSQKKEILAARAREGVRTWIALMDELWRLRLGVWGQESRLSS
ncbi:MAG: FAD-dependent oxidoreductase, partial [Deltaproteobacteria bacterium]|nr:FAD-dependent oxidoreductase [Deltaproteobacteria bacterium]